MAGNIIDEALEAVEDLLVQCYRMKDYIPSSDEQLRAYVDAATEKAEEILNPPKPKDYDICVYHLARTTVRRISATSPQKACKVAEEAVQQVAESFGMQWEGKTRGVTSTEDAEEVQGFLVMHSDDPESDEDVYYEYNEDGELEATEMKSYDQVRRNGS